MRVDGGSRLTNCVHSYTVLYSEWVEIPISATVTYAHHPL